MLSIKQGIHTVLLNVDACGKYQYIPLSDLKKINIKNFKKYESCIKICKNRIWVFVL